MKRSLAIGAAWDDALIQRLNRALPGWTIVAVGGAAGAARDATVLVPFGMRTDRALLTGSQIRLVHQFGVGVDNVDLEAARDLGISVVNSPSVQSGMAASVAEGAILLMLSCARLPDIRAKNLASGRWNWTFPLNLGLAGKTAGIIGYGSIGQAIAHRLAALGMHVCAVRRHGGRAEDVREGVDWVGGLDQLPKLIRDADFIVISAPLTPETHHLVNAEFLSGVKPGAVLVNVGRGAIVDENDLLDAIDSGQLHAAGLDTTQVEPLPADSPLLGHPRIVVTPHDAGVTESAFDGVAAIIAENVRRLESGEALLNRIV